MRSAGPRHPDEHFMARALQLAERGLYTTAPNPRVGCVLVREGEIVGEGWHRRAGEAHAEILALEDAGPRARGATAYVTLEPCAHQGRTGPCADALIAAGVARLVVGMEDPNPAVSGRGIARCREAGIDVTTGVGEAQARRLNPGFISRMSRGRPYVRLKMAMSLDGRSAMASGESQWITGNQARREVQRLRARSGAVISGVESLVQDDSRLTVREEESGLAPEQIVAQPLRVVVDSRLRMPLAASMLREEGRTLIFTRSSDEAKRANLEAVGAEVLVQPLSEQEEESAARSGVARVDLVAMIEHLARIEQCNEVLVETGASLAGAMFKAQLVDELVLFVAPTLMGSFARPLLDLELTAMDEQQRLVIDDIRAIGKDWRIIARPVSGDD
ncbi:bifunctional diaminohydroxyphosphoribosylaminopyrimidine deaminase/5-amino-6-(5-phosphoribosylamino)uracil reductase RibD [Halotalea alkalilenta]|uniref:bifunctional diaminohydroxyphosphoribosylaminopyrimidine deaminase/5-amino-6-(5-phosphoribosylamino)uracil reductase RibD n=1 Tax=Halotalea alkalilenta TaxID=376489 RepID=UPI0004845A76|nr:bifunctional diaminohydroxyphosphoribosylaminopyrimidine deaminase/5-amino-6-(5-phosphoribosylamino)uracil reductase RibD [Halotalea alkalilenta]